MRKLVIMAAVAVSLSACATKDFGRAPMIQTPQACLDVAAGYAELARFEEAIRQKGKFDRRTVTGIWLDFGVGNHMDRRAAEKSAGARRLELDKQAAALGCKA